VSVQNSFDFSRLFELMHLIYMRLYVLHMPCTVWALAFCMFQNKLSRPFLEPSLSFCFLMSFYLHNNYLLICPCCGRLMTFLTSANKSLERGLNPRPSLYESDALPTELPRHIVMIIKRFDSYKNLILLLFLWI
jgi:hypothetical protein